MLPLVRPVAPTTRTLGVVISAGNRREQRIRSFSDIVEQQRRLNSSSYTLVEGRKFQARRSAYYCKYRIAISFVIMKITGQLPVGVAMVEVASGRVGHAQRHGIPCSCRNSARIYNHHKVAVKVRMAISVTRVS